jgi:CheY-like chemotaxis protein
MGATMSADPGAASSDTGGGRAGGGAGRGRVHVLLAEDDEAMRAVVREMLVPMLADVYEAASGLELFTAIAAAGPFDLIITDLRMPWVSGLQAALAIRNAGVQAPLIVMSAFGDPALKRSVAGLPRAVFLDKPFSAAELRGAALAMLGQSEESL